MLKVSILNTFVKFARQIWQELSKVLANPKVLEDFTEI